MLLVVSLLRNCHRVVSCEARGHGQKDQHHDGADPRYGGEHLCFVILKSCADLGGSYRLRQLWRLKAVSHECVLLVIYEISCVFEGICVSDMSNTCCHS